MNVAALVSGGVDSSVMIKLLKDSGISPDIFYIKIAMEDEEGKLDCTYKEDVEIVMQIARQYGCRVEMVDLQQEYWEQVVSYTIETVRSGLTPNPDIMCNTLIKFGVFEDKVGKKYDKTATGHYASTTRFNNEVFLSTAKDKAKDQTYFLGYLSDRQISKLIFPLADLTKKEVREIARAHQIVSAERPDSQGICFLGKINYRDFLKRYLGEKRGKIIEYETGKILGEHKGFWFHTIGQRQGLGLSLGPWYVVKKNIPENIIFVSKGFDSQAQLSKIISLSGFHFFNKDLSGIDVENITFKIRHTPEFTKGKLHIGSEGNAAIESDTFISGIAPGQFGVVYDKQEKLCLGSGIITE